MNTLKNTLLNDWNAMRIIRLVLSLVILVQAIQIHDAMFGLFGAFFLVQALTNTGCCAGGSCAAPTSSVPKRNAAGADLVEYEEVK